MLNFIQIPQDATGEEAAEIIVQNSQLLETYTNAMGTVKADFQLSEPPGPNPQPYDDYVLRMHLYSYNLGTMLRVELRVEGVLFLRKREGVNQGYVRIEPFTGDLMYGQALAVSKSKTEFIPVGPEDCDGSLCFLFQRNILQFDLANTPVVLLTWYFGGLSSPFSLIQTVYQAGREFGSELYMYTQDAQNITVTAGAGGSYNLNLLAMGGGLPTIFKGGKFRYGLIAGGTYNILPGQYAVLSTTTPAYTRPQANMAQGTPLYILSIDAGQWDQNDNPIILGIVAGGKWNANYKLLEGAATPPPAADEYARIRGKKGNFQGDSITEQAFFTNWLATNAGVVVQNRGVSGTGYVQDQGTGSTMYTRAALIAADAPDFIVDFAGTNDWAGVAFAGAPLGSMATIADVTTFYGAVYQTIKRTRSQNKNVPYLICTPIQRNYNNTEPRGYVNSRGLTFEVYVQAIRDIAPIFSARVLDLYNMAGITHENLDTTTSDGVHINNLGGAMVGRNMAVALCEMMYS